MLKCMVDHWLNQMTNIRFNHGVLDAKAGFGPRLILTHNARAHNYLPWLTSNVDH